METCTHNLEPLQTCIYPLRAQTFNGIGDLTYVQAVKLIYNVLSGTKEMHMVGRLGNVDVRVQKLARAVSTTDAHFRMAGKSWRDSYLYLTNHHYSGVVGTKLLG